jgi:hypothetical protein
VVLENSSITKPPTRAQAVRDDDAAARCCPEQMVSTLRGMRKLLKRRASLANCWANHANSLHSIKTTVFVVALQVDHRAVDVEVKTLEFDCGHHRYVAHDALARVHWRTDGSNGRSCRAARPYAESLISTVLMVCDCRDVRAC